MKQLRSLQVLRRPVHTISREYRVQFYARTCTWTQRQVDIQTGKTVASKTGQADVPSKYLLYSLDHLMG